MIPKRPIDDTWRCQRCTKAVKHEVKATGKSLIFTCSSCGFTVEHK